jgi:hypothetical protein
MVLQRALAPITSSQSAMASCNSEQTVARDNKSSAPEALEVASALGNILGETSHKLFIFIFFIARATAPIFPG